MTSLYCIKVIKTLMVTTPFLTLILMVLALWGVGGKTTYTDLNFTKQQMKLGVGEAKNYFVKETQSNELPSTELENPKINIEEKSATTKKDPLPQKISWGLMV